MRGTDPDELDDDMLDGDDLDDDLEGPAFGRGAPHDERDDGPPDGGPGDGALGLDGRAPRPR